MAVAAGTCGRSLGFPAQDLLFDVGPELRLEILHREALGMSGGGAEPVERDHRFHASYTTFLVIEKNA